VQFDVWISKKNTYTYIHYTQLETYKFKLIILAFRLMHKSTWDIVPNK